QEWQALFNGKDLTGWDIKITGYPLNYDPLNTFRVEEGLLKVRYEQYDTFGGRFGHLFHQQTFSNYRLRAEYRFVGEQVAEAPPWATKNSGLMIHGQSAKSMELMQDFPISLEVQLLGGLGEEDRPTANLCTPGTDVMMNNQWLQQHCINSSAPTFHDDRWVTVEVLVLEDSLIQHYVNGDTVLTYHHPKIHGGVVNGYNESVKQDGKPLTEGSISLQSESHPIDFRKIEVMVLE
ncbi:MAG: DUF1080 domain-containing protein, partial [Bacteroidota bacterium]